MTTKLPDILTIIPQRPPFVFVDRMLRASMEQVQVVFLVTEACPLVEDGCLRLAGLVEHAAQACAARAGWLQQVQHQAIRIGYIGAIKQIEATRLPQIGETLTTTATLIQEVANISLLECVTCVGDEQIAHTTIKLALAEE